MSTGLIGDPGIAYMDARVCGHTTMAENEMKFLPPARPLCPVVNPVPRLHE